MKAQVKNFHRLKEKEEEKEKEKDEEKEKVGKAASGAEAKDVRSKGLLAQVLRGSPMFPRHICATRPDGVSEGVSVGVTV